MKVITVDREIFSKVCCGALAGEFFLLSFLSTTEKPEIILPNNVYEHPYEPLNYPQPTWENAVVASTANVAPYPARYNIL